MLIANPSAKMDHSFVKKYSFLDNYHGLTFTELDKNTKDVLSTGLLAKQKKFLKIFYASKEQKSSWDFKIQEMGTWDTNYYRRAYYAVWGIGANILQDAVYGTSQLDADLEQLNGNSTYKLSFPAGKTPEVGGFWSTTAYNNEGFLTPNGQNRYSIGSNMPLVFNKDGSLEIYLSADKPKGAPNYNWVPTPKGTFKVLFRMYWPKESILNGSYSLPNIEKL